MEEHLVSFETAKLAKEKGFTIICRNFSKDGEVIYDVFDPKPILAEPPFIEVPTQSLLQRWLREVHYIIVYNDTGIYGQWRGRVSGYDRRVNVALPELSYEDCLELSLIEGLKLIP